MASERAAQAFVFGSVLIGGFVLWRGRHRGEILSDSFDFDKSAGSRHMVPMHRRLDEKAVRVWLAEEDAKVGAGTEEMAGVETVSGAAGTKLL